MISQYLHLGTAHLELQHILTSKTKSPERRGRHSAIRNTVSVYSGSKFNTKLSTALRHATSGHTFAFKMTRSLERLCQLCARISVLMQRGIWFLFSISFINKQYDLYEPFGGCLFLSQAA